MEWGGIAGSSISGPHGSRCTVSSCRNAASACVRAVWLRIPYIFRFGACVLVADKERRTRNRGVGGGATKASHPLPSPAPSCQLFVVRTHNEPTATLAGGRERLWFNQRRASTQAVQQLAATPPLQPPRCSGCCAWLHLRAQILGCWGVDRAGRYALACALVLHMLVKAVRQILNPGGLRLAWIFNIPACNCLPQ